MRKSIVLAGLLALVPSLSQAKTLEDLLVEKGIVTKSEAQASSSSGAAKVYWNKGSRFEFDNGFTAQLNTLVQTRYTFTDEDEDSGDRNTSSFDITRARILVSGTALNKEFAYFVQPDFVGNGKNPTLLDAYVEWRPNETWDIRMGQYKTNLSRQFLNSDTKLQFPDRSAASQYFDLGRQAGASATGRWLDDNLTVTAGIYNGESDGEGINRSGRDTKHTGIVSVRYVALGKIDSFEEGDINHSEEAGLSFGSSYAFSDREQGIGEDGLTEDNEVNTVAVDANFKYSGWSAHAEIYSGTTDPDVSKDADAVGFYAQLGWAFNPKTMEVAVRYSLVDCDDGAAGAECSGLDKINEVTAGLNYFFWGHSLKAQLAYVLTNEDQTDESGGEDLNTNKIQFQIGGFF